MKSYAGDKDGKHDEHRKDSAAQANQAARKAEAELESIKEEARNEMKRQEKP